MTLPTGLELTIRWLQLIIGLVYPLVLMTVAWLAWRDFHRWVNHQLNEKEAARQAEARLEMEVQEFIE